MDPLGLSIVLLAVEPDFHPDKLLVSQPIDLVLHQVLQERIASLVHVLLETILILE